MPITTVPASPEPDIWDQVENDMATAKENFTAAEETQNAVAAGRIAAEAESMPDGLGKVPYYIQQAHSDYLSKIAHVFIFHGNITDYADNSGNYITMLSQLSTVYDSQWIEDLLRQQNKGKLPLGYPPSKRARVLCYYTVNNGLVFVSSVSRKIWVDMMTDFYRGKEDELKGDDLATVLNPPNDIMAVMRTLNLTFEASKGVAMANRAPGAKFTQPFKFTVAFYNGNLLFPAGPILHLQGDRTPIGYMYNWAHDNLVAEENRVIILTPSLSDIHETLRGGDSAVSSIIVRRPNLEERETWLINYSNRLANIENFDKGKKIENGLYVAGKFHRGIDYAPEMKIDKPVGSPLTDEEFSRRMMALQTAGLNLRQMDQIVRSCWRGAGVVDLDTIATHKKAAVEALFGDLCNFVEPMHGFETIGGHEAIKEYFLRNVKGPLARGDKRTCSKGFILCGPPGTGKTQLVLGMAKECKFNFIDCNLASLFAGTVGATEANTAKLIQAIESASPCLVFMDEFESSLSSGRSSPGDSGTSGRVFNSLMKFLSDDSRAGKIVVAAATNRPDLLDAAIIREGRFDAILAACPPNPQSTIQHRKVGKNEKPCDCCRCGRTQILKSIMLKRHVRLSKDGGLSGTGNSTTNGLGRLLNDSRVWTGAQIETILKEATNNAQYDGREEINLADWDDAMDSVLPNTRDIEYQIDLALYFVNNMKYCPREWKERALRVKGHGAPPVQHVMSDGGGEREL